MALTQEPVKIANLDREYAILGERMREATTRVLARGSFILGPEVNGLEAELATYLGVKHVVTCANGTDALVLALRAAMVGPGDEVIVPSFTFAATGEAVALVGAVPVFADIDLDTFLLDAADVERRLTPRTKAVIPVHLFGLCVALQGLRALVAGREVTLIEDAAQAIGAHDGAARAGAVGDAAAFSFYPTKNLGGSGDGGMVTTNSDRIAEQVRLLRSHGSAKSYIHEIIGTNSRLDDIQAAVLRLKLPHLDSWNEKRRANAAIYRSAAEKTGLIVPSDPVRGTHVYHHFTVRTADRNGFIKHLGKFGIGHGIYYPIPLHRQKAFERWVPQNLTLPSTDRAAVEVVSLPVHPWLTDEEIGRVAEALRAWREPE
jgi:dTDP-4-amino-4,6-dideoxygalactose transaminase